MTDMPHPESPILRVTSRTAGTALVLELTGEVDMLSAGQVTHAIETAVAGGGLSALVVDLTDVSFLDSAGLAVLAHGHMTVAERVPFRIVATQLSTIKPIRLTGLDKLLALYDTVADALAQE